MMIALGADQPAVGELVHRVEAIGPLPRNVEWLHHGAVSGIDNFREVSRIVVVGRQAPSPSAVQASCALRLARPPDLLLPLGSGIGDRRIAGVER